MKAANRDAEHEGVVDFLAVARGFKSHPAKRKRKGHGGGEQASPSQKPVGGPADPRAPFNEALKENVVPEDSAKVQDVPRRAFWAAKTAAILDTNTCEWVAFAATSSNDSQARKRQTPMRPRRTLVRDRSPSGRGCRQRSQQSGMTPQASPIRKHGPYPNRELEIQAVSFAAFERPAATAGAEGCHSRTNRQISENAPSSTKPSANPPVCCLMTPEQKRREEAAQSASSTNQSGHTAY